MHQSTTPTIPFYSNAIDAVLSLYNMKKEGKKKEIKKKKTAQENSTVKSFIAV